MRRDDGAGVDGCGSAKRQLCVQRSEWKGHVTAPKGGRLRYVPLTVAWQRRSASHRHLVDARVLCPTMASR